MAVCNSGAVGQVGVYVHGSAIVGITPNTFGVPFKSNAVVQLSARLAQLAVLLCDTDLVLHVSARLSMSYQVHNEHRRRGLLPAEPGRTSRTRSRASYERGVIVSERRASKGPGVSFSGSPPPNVS